MGRFSALSHIEMFIVIVTCQAYLENNSGNQNLAIWKVSKKHF